MCFVKKKNILTCFFLICVISLFLPLNTIAQSSLPKYEIVEEKFDRTNKAPFVQIYVYMDKSATEKQIKKIIWHIYKTKIITDPRYENPHYGFRIGITFDLDAEMIVANYMDKKWVFKNGPKYELNKGVFDGIKNDETCYRVRKGYLVDEFTLPDTPPF